MTTEKEIHKWLAGYPRAWANLCQALMWRLCQAFGLVPYDGIDSATDAYNIEKKAGRIRTDAPPATGGVFIYFSVPGVPDGHVGYLMNGGRLLMASTTLIEEWVDSDAGYSTIDKYVKDHKATVLGWSYLNAGNSVTGWTPDSAPAPAPEWAFNEPDKATQASIQQGLKDKGRYSGPVDGDWGVNSIKGIQTTIRNVGYTGPIDGVPGERTCHYVQVYAAKFGGYTGPVDSVLGPNSWAGFNKGVTTP